MHTPLPEQVDTGQGASPGPDKDSPRHGAFKRLFLAFTSPGEVFEDIRRKPGWILCLILITLVSVALVLVITPHVDVEATIREQAAAFGIELTEEQIEQRLEQSQKLGFLRPVGAAVVVPLGFFALAGVFLLMLKLVGSEVDYRRTLSATVHAYWPSMLTASALSGFLVQRIGKATESELHHLVKSNLGAFLSPDTPAWLTHMASSIDVFNIWIMVLLVLGFSAVGSVSRQRAAVVTLVPWLVYIAGKGLVLGLLFG
jgi:hypothetical protein